MITEVPTSYEIGSVANTVPSESEHADILEAIENYCQGEIARTLALAYENIRKLNVFFDEQMQRNPTETERIYLEVAIQRKIDEIHREKDWTKKRIYMERDSILQSFHQWENGRR